jgi:DNA repair exonuclease SbcCD nuclease subunit
MVSRREFLNATPAALLALAALPRTLTGAEAPATPVVTLKPPKIGFSSRAAEIEKLKPARITTASPKSCRILQFTDLHFLRHGDEDDRHTIEDFKRHLDHQRPDLVVITGDLWHDNPEGRGRQGVERALEAFTGWGVPWTMNWGNHDLLDDYQPAHDLFEQARFSAYRGALTHGDHRIEILAPGDTAETPPRLDLYLLNSNEEGLTAWQADALGRMTRHVAGQRAKPAPALAFFHIPILEYETRLSPKTFSGSKLEGVGRVKENGRLFPVIAGAGTMQACFCGHNHTNDYVVQADNVDLVYGRSTGYAGYGAEKLRKGAKLIEVDLATGKYEQTSVLADGSNAIP